MLYKVKNIINVLREEQLLHKHYTECAKLAGYVDYVYTISVYVHR